ncbi:MAG: FKBP-type peptidyl-prolyl cis-trans isomerase [Bacteroidales bacterium]
MKKARILIIMTMLAVVTSCGSSGDKSFEQTENGLEYVFHERSDGEMPETERILSMNMVYSVEDSVLFDNENTGMPMYLQLIEPEYPGDIYEGLGMMAIGDSASFRIDAEDFFTQTAGMTELPPFVEPGSKLTFDVKLLRAMNEEEFAEEQERLMEEQMEADMERADQEEGLRDAYLDEEGITVDPTPSGLYFVEEEPGDGPRVEEGQTVAVHYEGRLLDGTVFDSSYERDEPLEFVVGEGRVIEGWDEGVAMMREGGEARLIVPSSLAYGEMGAGELIPPFSTLVFDVEVVEIVDPS